jgi:hypothetical protein
VRIDESLADGHASLGYILTTRVNDRGERNMRIVLTIVGLLLFGASPLHAQWLKHPTPGIPRAADGQPNLSAPTPRTVDGKPDFSGVWGMDAGPSLFYIPANLKPEEIKPWAAELVKERTENYQRDDPLVRCLPEGPRFNHFLAFPKKIVQTPSLIIVLGEDLSYRQIFLDGRQLPPDPNPSFMGYSVGHWEGDTLVVETIGYKDVTWLDFAGHPHSEALRLTERYRRVDSGHMEIQETFQDRDIYSRPLTVTVKATLLPDTELLEYVCAENEKDRQDQRLVGTLTEEMKSIKPVKVAPTILAQYVGLYDFRFPENPTVPSLWPVTMANGELFLQGAPLLPLSETQFFWAGSNRIEFVRDSQGGVTHFVATFVEGDMIVRRIPDRK